MWPRITIITPSFNQGDFLEQTILSVLNQQYPNLEYIIIDGGSTDHSVDIIKKYASKLAFWISEQDGGQSDALNKGFEMATGEVVNWLNSDDYYEPGALHIVGSAFSNPSINAYCGINRSFSLQKEAFSSGTDLYPHNLLKTLGLARIDQPETFFRKSCIDEIGFVNEGLHFVMDKDLWFRFLSRFGMSGVLKTSALLAHFRLHNASKTVSLQAQFIHETRRLFYTYASVLGFNNFANLYRDLFEVDEMMLTHTPFGLECEAWRQVFNYYTLSAGLACYAANDFYKAKRLLESVDPSCLCTEDALHLQQVKSRMIVPVYFKIAFNKLRSSASTYFTAKRSSYVAI